MASIDPPASSSPLRVLAVVHDVQAPWSAALLPLADSPWGPFIVERCEDHDSAAQRLAQSAVDAIVADEAVSAWPGLAQTALQAAVLLVAHGQPHAADLRRWMRAGVQDVLPTDALGDPQALGRALRLAVERKRLEREARKAYATDLATGLPSHNQLVEHMSHLLALRERQPAAMALLVLRLEGLHTAEHRMGAESAQVLRRKAAVRLRAGVRASDVVASLGHDAFAVLLSAIEEPEHAERVAGKLSAALQQPFRVAGEQIAVAVSVGTALYPADGRLADALLRSAVAAAATSSAVGRAGFANRLEAGDRAAANDDQAP